jgi:hypothetical protein
MVVPALETRSNSRLSLSSPDGMSTGASVPAGAALFAWRSSARKGRQELGRAHAWRGAAVKHLQVSVYRIRVLGLRRADNVELTV